VPSPGSCVRCSRPLDVESVSGLCPECLRTTGPGGDTHRDRPPPAGRLSPLAPDPDDRTRTLNRPPEATTATFVPAAVPVPMPPAPAGYELIRELGAGGMGVVYLARDHTTEQLVAMKFLQRPGSQTAFDRFLVELRALAALNHPHIIRVLGHDFLRADPYFVTEYAPGGSLSAKLEAGGPLDPAEAARLVAAAARAVHAAHAARVIHRDLKPSNILLAADGSPRVSDFGLAKRTDRDDQLTASGPLGTPAYMAPEQAGPRDRPADARTDVYGLGATLYHLVAGWPPFSGPHEEVIRRVLKEPPAPPRDVRRAVPVELEAIILKCLEKDPDRRYQTAEELADDLDRFLAGGIPEAPLLTWRRRVALTLRRRRRALTVAGAVALVVAGAFVLGAALWPAPKTVELVQPPDPAEEIRKQLADGQEVVLADTTGLPRYSRFLVEPGAVGESELGDKTAAFHAFYDSLVELCPAPGINRYRVSLEIRHLQTKGLSSKDAEPETDFLGFYFSHATRTLPSGATVHAMFALTYREFDRDFDPVARPGQPPKPQSVFLRRYGLYLKPGDKKPGDDKPDAELGLRVSEKAAGLRFTPKLPRPGLWRPVILEVKPDEIHLRWQTDDGKMTTLARWADGQPAAEYENLKASFDKLIPGAAAALPAWSPDMPFGLLSRRSSVAFRNLVITPLP